jgi:hypothetical protein
MRRTLGYSLRFTTILVVLAMIALALLPASATPTPYASALSTLALASDVEAAGCGKMHCKLGTFCEPKNHFNCTMTSDMTCIGSAC